jgi:hypothetical protein
MIDKSAKTPVEVVTRSHMFTGLLAVEGYRVADALNGSASEMIDLEAAVVRPLGRDAGEFHCPQICLKKTAVVMAIPQGVYEAPVRRLGSRVLRQKCPASIVLPGLSVSGILHLPSHVGTVAVVGPNSTLARFIAVTDAKVDGLVTGGSLSSHEVVIVQRDLIEAIYLSVPSRAK